MNLRQVLNDDKFRTKVRSWWSSLASDRGQRAQLCRCKTPMEIYISAAYRDGFVSKVSGCGFSEDDLECLAFGAGLLAHARIWENRPLPAVFAAYGKGSPGMRDVRFRKLLAIGENEPEELYTMLVRIIRQCENRGGSNLLFDVGIEWNQDVRNTWAKAYYSNRPKS